MIKRSKEEARPDRVEIFLRSWTYNRLTAGEKNEIIQQLATAPIKGTYKQRCEQLNTIYFSFLESIGYKPIGWRTPDGEETPQF